MTKSKPVAADGRGLAHAAKTRGKMLKSVRKREQILHAAAKVFWEKGYAEATLNDIAEEIGTQAGSFYYYFASREDLVTEVLMVAITSVTQLVEKAVGDIPPDATPLERLKTALKARVCASLDKNYFILALVKIIDQVPPEVREKYMVLSRKYAQFWDELFIAARDAGQIRSDLDMTVVRLFVLSSANFAMEWYRPDGRLTAAEVADALITLFIDGISPRPAQT